MISVNLSASINRALQLAYAYKHEFFGLEHLLYALMDDPDAKPVLLACGIHFESLAAALEEVLESHETLKHPIQPMPTLACERAINRAIIQMQNAGKDEVSGAQVLVAMFDEENTTTIAILEEQGMTRLDALEFISHGKTKISVAPNADDGQPIAAPARANDPLALYCHDLIAKAKDGTIDPLIARDYELERLMQVLARRSKNNPVLVGDPGVGKTAIVEGLARRIVEHAVPEVLQDVGLYALDMGALLAGTRFRGDFEERLKSVVEALRGTKNVLFIDEIHTIVRAGAVEGGAMDASNLLKPVLAKGELRTIGATTYEEFKAFEKDRALSRRFQKIDVPEPSPEDTVHILKGLAPYYESHHQLKFTAASIKSAVELSVQYLHERRLPDKAIDVLDEAGAVEALKPRHKRLKTITPRQIEAVVAKMARLPLGKVKTAEQERLHDLEPELLKVVYGQDHAIKLVSDTVKLARAGLRSEGKPVGSFLFSGPTGVGKTELAKQLAHTLNAEFLRFDMSEYMEQHSVSRLIGAPPGYVGFDQGGLLSDAVHKHPNSVLLLDEIEKAHPNIYNILLQVMDYGKLTDHNGKHVDFRSVVIILTTNAGAEEMSKPALGFNTTPRVGDDTEAIKRTFSPEFRNRLDAIVRFNPLSPQVMRQVVNKFLTELQQQLHHKNVTLQVSEEAKIWLAKTGYQPSMGARPMSRVFQDILKKPIAEELLFGKLQKGGRVNASLQGEKVVLEYFQ